MRRGVGRGGCQSFNSFLGVTLDCLAGRGVAALQCTSTTAQSSRVSLLTVLMSCSAFTSWHKANILTKSKPETSTVVVFNHCEPSSPQACRPAAP